MPFDKFGSIDTHGREISFSNFEDMKNNVGGSLITLNERVGKLPVYIGSEISEESGDLESRVSTAFLDLFVKGLPLETRERVDTLGGSYDMYTFNVPFDNVENIGEQSGRWEKFENYLEENNYIYSEKMLRDALSSTEKESDAYANQQLQNRFEGDQDGRNLVTELHDQWIAAVKQGDAAGENLENAFAKGYELRMNMMKDMLTNSESKKKMTKEQAESLQKFRTTQKITYMREHPPMQVIGVYVQGIASSLTTNYISSRSDQVGNEGLACDRAFYTGELVKSTLNKQNNDVPVIVGEGHAFTAQQEEEIWQGSLDRSKVDTFQGGVIVLAVVPVRTTVKYIDNELTIVSN